MNDVFVHHYKNMQKARSDLQQEIISENMMGVDFSSLLWECRPVVMLTRLTEDFGGYEMEFRKVKNNAT